MTAETNASPTDVSFGCNMLDSTSHIQGRFPLSVAVSGNILTNTSRSDLN
jgi:hypothetical protein